VHPVLADQAVKKSRSIHCAPMPWAPRRSPGSCPSRP
jgi:hypothetical protein